jgi:hypothetical protein
MFSLRLVVPVCTIPLIGYNVFNSPTGPDSMYARSLSNVHNEIDICVVVVVASTRHLDVTIGHSDVFGVDSEILRRSHDGKFDGSLIPKSLVAPFPDGTDLFYGSNTVVGNEDLVERVSSDG